MISSLVEGSAQFGRVDGVYGAIYRFQLAPVQVRLILSKVFEVVAMSQTVGTIRNYFKSDKNAACHWEFYL